MMASGIASKGVMARSAWMAIGCIDAGLSYLNLEKMDINGPILPSPRTLPGRSNQRKRIFDRQRLAGIGVLVGRGIECYTFQPQPVVVEWISFERSMPRPSPSRSSSRTRSGTRGRVMLRWHLGNSSTKVLFGHPASPSTFVPHAAAPAPPAIFSGGLLFLRARNL